MKGSSGPVPTPCGTRKDPSATDDSPSPASPLPPPVLATPSSTSLRSSSGPAGPGPPVTPRLFSPVRHVVSVSTALNDVVGGTHLSRRFRLGLRDHTSEHPCFTSDYPTPRTSPETPTPFLPKPKRLRPGPTETLQVCLSVHRPPKSSDVKYLSRSVVVHGEPLLSIAYQRFRCLSRSGAPLPSGPQGAPRHQSPREGVAGVQTFQTCGGETFLRPRQSREPERVVSLCRAHWATRQPLPSPPRPSCPQTPDDPT